VTESALPQARLVKTESPPKIWLPAADHAVWDAMEDTLLLLGNGGKKPESLLVVYTETILDANLTAWPLVTTTPPANINLALQSFLHLIVSMLAIANTQLTITPINM